MWLKHEEAGPVYVYLDHFKNEYSFYPIIIIKVEKLKKIPLTLVSISNLHEIYNQL